MTDGISSDELKEAIGRIAQSFDGEMLYLWLQKQLMALPVGSITDGALREFNGRRMLVAELIALMSEGIRLSGRSDTVRPIVFRTGSEPSVRPRPSLRRVSADTFVPGFSAPADEPDRHPSEPAADRG